MKFPELILDLDGVVADFFTPLLEIYNKKTGCDLTVYDINCHLENLGPRVLRDLIDIFNAPRYFSDLKPLPEAINIVSQFEEYGYKTIICTAPARDNDGGTNGLSAAEKYEWIKKYLPWWSNHIIITKHKERVFGDMIIDDYSMNILNWCKAHENGIGFLVDQPWNRSLSYLPKNAVRGTLEQVSEFIDKFWCQERGIWVYRFDELKEWQMSSIYDYSSKE